MKPFDLDAARRGAAVCIAESRDVTLLGFDDVAQCICGYILSSGANLHEHYMWQLSGSGGTPAYDLKMRDDDYAERLARGEYDFPDCGFIRDITPEHKPADQEYPKAEMGFTEVPPAFDGVAIATILAQLFGSTAPTSRLRINIEYDGGALNIDQDRVSELLKAYGYGIAEATREPKPDQGTA